MNLLLTRDGAVTPLTFKDSKTGEVFTAIQPPIHGSSEDVADRLLKYAASMINHIFSTEVD